ncbi:TPA: hypothetical protein UN269_001215 [Stenotrophomonas maltophilia]|nr:hypothetical protein [Stenotrophomonas maltophilia]
MENLQDSGLFWLGDGEELPTQLPPSGCVAGLLKISDDGTATLDLIGLLAGEVADGHFPDLDDAPPRTVRGILKSHGEHVLLTNVRTVSARLNDLISSEIVQADTAVVSRNPIISSQFIELTMPLDGFEAWARPGSVSAERPLSVGAQRQAMTLDLTRDSDKAYETSLGTLTFQTDFSGPLPSYDSTSVGISIRSQLVLQHASQISLEQTLDYFRGFQDLILLLSNSTRSLPWPLARSSSCDGLVRIYFSRANQHHVDFNRHQCWLSLTRLEKEFGAVVDSWFDRRRDLGPGLHLFLGMRRPRPMYLEHKFVNLAWGLESLHRRLYGADVSANEKLSMKRDRILSVLSKCDWPRSDDKKFAMRRFNNMEPSLAERIEQLLLSIGLDFERSKLRDFAERCADHRNDLSHFGGERVPGTYSDVITGYVELLHALSPLYHLLLLHLIGISEIHIYWLVNKHRDRIRHRLAHVGLSPYRDTARASLLESSLPS